MRYIEYVLGVNGNKNGLKSIRIFNYLESLKMKTWTELTFNIITFYNLVMQQYDYGTWSFYLEDKAFLSDHNVCLWMFISETAS